MKLFLFRCLLLYAIKYVEHLVAAADMGFIVEVAEEDNHHVVGRAVEEKILELQETKQNLADEILSGNTGGIGSMSREELLALLD